MSPPRRRVAALLCAVALLSGCFTYVPASLETIQVGQEVQVHLTPSAQVELSQRGTRIEGPVRGRLAERRNADILLKMPIAREREGFFRSDIELDLPVPTNQIVGIDRRRFSGSRTALLVAGSAGAGALIVLTIIAATRSGSGGPAPGPEELRVPLFSPSAR